MPPTLVVIPARLQSTRLPAKPLADINGTPMIVHVWRRAVEADVGRVVVASDTEAINAVIRAAGGEAVLTRPDHASGSDRVFEAVSRIDGAGSFEIILNLQGDLPSLAADVARACLEPLRAAGPDIATIAVEITREEERTDPNVVKLVGTPTTVPGRSIITSASMPIAGRRSSASCRCRPRCLSAASGSSSCARSRTACASTPASLTPCRSGSIRRPTSSAPANSLPASRRSGVGAMADRKTKPTPTAKPKRVTPLVRQTSLRVSYQGEPGANSHLACREVFPDLDATGCATFEDALGAVKSGEARYAMIPIENSVAGRVADIHHLLPDAGLHIVGEHFLRVRHQLMALPTATLLTVEKALSHTQALGQCRNTLRKLGLVPVPEADTAGSARIVAESKDLRLAAIAATLAAEIYGLKILMRDIEDEKHNTTRFVVLSATPENAVAGNGAVITTFLFRVRNVPAALYKAMGGFATNGVNMTKLESYQLDGRFVATMFYADIEGHPDDPPVARALEELSFFSSELKILGAYSASPYRAEANRLSQ